MTSNHKEGEAIERLWIVLNKYYPNLPRRISIYHRGKQHEVELEKYVLRHTFWRPRDVLKYFAKLLAYHELSKRHHRSVDSEGIRYCIAETTPEIVDTEFLGEFRGICYNIGEVIEKFRRSDQVLPYEAVYNIINDVEFLHVDDTYRPRTFREKLEFLYRIGFLGIMVSPEIRDDMRILTNELFYFSDGDAILGSLGDDEISKIKFIIHPVFCEKLRINTKNNDLCLLYTDEYLDRNDTI